MIDGCWGGLGLQRFAGTALLSSARCSYRALRRAGYNARRARRGARIKHFTLSLLPINMANARHARAPSRSRSTSRIYRAGE